jgi:twitching motility protein PilT
MLLSEIQTGKKYQMQTMDNALLELYQKGEITYDVALSAARDQNLIKHKAG